MSDTPIIRMQQDPFPFAVVAAGEDPAFQSMPVRKEPKHHMMIAGNLCVVMNRFEKEGDAGWGHEHHFDHQSLLTNGKVMVNVDGVVTKHEAPKMLFIPAGKKHQFVALADDTILWCVHAVRDGDGDVIDPDSRVDQIHPISKGNQNENG